MRLFISDEEFERCSHDASLVADKADAFIKDLHRQLETVKAQADAASITAEQTCSLLEQKYISLSSDFERLESQNAQLNASIERHVSELAQVQSEKHQLHLKSIERDGDIERLSTEVSELHKSKRQLLEIVEHKDLEINEKNATIKSYLDKIVNLTDDAALKQAHFHDREAELARSQATCARLSQEKELIERHNIWLNEELTVKMHDLIEVRRTHTEVVADLSGKLTDVEKQYEECSSSLKWNKGRVKELETKLISSQEELRSSSDSAAANEERFSAEVSTVTKLVELYKESSEEWSKKAGELDGVIKALETHLSQVEGDYKEKLQKEVSARKLHEKEAAELKEKLEKCEADIENCRKTNELSLLPISSFAEETWTYRSDTDSAQENDRMLVPKIPVGVSGTALAASLLRDGWSLAKMYEKYQEAVDALRHESMGRKQSQAMLDRILYELQERAEVILDERAEHERMVESYSAICQKLQQSNSEQVKLEGMIQELKADLRRSQREYDGAQKEILDLQKQVAFVLKECRDIQLRCGSGGDVNSDDSAITFSVDTEDMSDTEKVISERLLTFRDIRELVEQNVKLRSLVRSLSDVNEKRDTELKEMFQMELRKQIDEAAAKVAAVLDRAEDQGKMIESLHSSVAMYKRLYEEELKLRASYPDYHEAIPDQSRKGHMLLLEDSQDAAKKALEHAVERSKNLEEELDKSRKEGVSLRHERDKLSMESNFLRERLDSFKKEFEHQRGEMNSVIARNVEFTQLVVEYQRKVRESSDSLRVAEDLSRKLTVEVSLLKHEKELLVNSEKRACDEVRSLSERVNRLQATLNTIHSTEEVREEAKLMEKRKQEDYLKQVERDWALVKKELQEERDNIRSLTLDREHTVKNSMKQVEELGKQLADALRAVASAESRAAVAEARCSDLEAKFKVSQDKLVPCGSGPSTSLNIEANMELPMIKEELEKLKEEAQANKDHMLQYKNIAHVNEVALKQIECAHESFKVEADKMKISLESEISSLRERLSELESDSASKSEEAASLVAGKEAALNSALVEIDRLKEENSLNISQITAMEIQISFLKDDLEVEHQRWRTAQNNYERQVILQSETIQELTKTSQALGILQEEISQLRKLADSLKSENDILKEKLASDKSVLGKSKDEAEKKFNEINEQNNVLHTHLEALHIKLAEKERHSAGSSGSNGQDLPGDGDLQTVVGYLRRSKEIAETEISLLKQEKLRLQSQLERAMSASEAAQSQLHAERANSRALLFSDEDFKSLQIQVREMNLLRESNLQLREENKHNFEECQKLRELTQKTKFEMEQLETMLREKNNEVESCRKEIEIQKTEKENLENKIVELRGACNKLDVEDYNRLKDDYQKIQGMLRAIEADLDETRKLVTEQQNSITCLEQELANTRVEITQKDTRIKESLQAETSLKLDLERQRKAIAQYKRKFETTNKEKEDLSKEMQSAAKQLEDSKQGKRVMGDTSNEQAMKEKEKEKDTRIQILERTLEREREEARKEKALRLKFQKSYEKSQKTYEISQLAVESAVKSVKEEHMKIKNEVERILKEFGRLNQEVERVNQSRESLPEGCVQPASQACETDLNNQMASYSQAVQNLEDKMGSFNEELTASAPPVETSTADTSSPDVRQVPAQTFPIPPSGTVARISLTKPAGERDRSSNLPKHHVESRKIARKLNRPFIARPQQASGDTEMFEIDANSNVEGRRDITLPTTQPAAKKRVAPLSGSELHEAHIQVDASSSAVPPLSKRSKSEPPRESVEVQVSVPLRSLETLPTPEKSVEAPADQSHAATELLEEKEEVTATGEMDEEAKESPLDAIPNSEQQSNELFDASEELLDNTREAEELGEGLKDDEDQDPQLIATEMDSDKEEGELPPDLVEELDSGDILPTSLDSGDVQSEPTSLPDVATSIGDEEHVSAEGEAIETVPFTNIAEEKNDMVEGVEESAEESDKSINDNEQVVTETEKSPKRSFGGDGSSSPSNPPDNTTPYQGNPIATPAGEEDDSTAEKSTTIILSERARERKQLRVQGLVPSPAETAGIGSSKSAQLRVQGLVAAPAESAGIGSSKSGRGTPPKRDASVSRRGAVRGARGARGGRRPAADEGQG